MRILIEEHKYQAADVKDILHGIDALESVEGYVSLNYVGYFYNTELKDCVFILPKVLLEDKDGKELVFGKHDPTDIINLDIQNPLSETEKKFIYEFAVWIYRAIVVFQQGNKESGIVYHKKIIQAGKGRRTCAYWRPLLSLSLREYFSAHCCPILGGCSILLRYWRCGAGFSFSSANAGVTASTRC